MKSVGSYEAKTHLPKLLDRVEKGESITITKRGKPVAKLVPIGDTGRGNVKSVIAAFRAYSAQQGRTLGGMTIREMIEEGRR